MRGGAELKESRAKDQFLLVSLAGGMPKEAVEDAAKSLCTGWFKMIQVPYIT